MCGYIWGRKLRGIWSRIIHDIRVKKSFLFWLCSNIKKVQICIFAVPHFVGNKVKRRISKRVFQENKARQIFQKTNISYTLIRKRTFLTPLYAQMCVSGGKKCSFLGKFDLLYFFENLVWDSVFWLITDNFSYSKQNTEIQTRRKNHHNRTGWYNDFSLYACRNFQIY